MHEEREGGESPTHIPWGFSYTSFLTISIRTSVVRVTPPCTAGVIEPGLWVDRRRIGSSSLNSSFILLDLGFLSFGSHCSDTVGSHTPKCPCQRYPKKVAVVSCREKSFIPSVSACQQRHSNVLLIRLPGGHRRKIRRQIPQLLPVVDMEQMMQVKQVA